MNCGWPPKTAWLGWFALLDEWVGYGCCGSNGSAQWSQRKETNQQWNSEWNQLHSSWAALCWWNQWRKRKEWMLMEWWGPAAKGLAQFVEINWRMKLMKQMEQLSSFFFSSSSNRAAGVCFLFKEKTSQSNKLFISFHSLRKKWRIVDWIKRLNVAALLLSIKWVMGGAPLPRLNCFPFSSRIPIHQPCSSCFHWREEEINEK